MQAKILSLNSGHPTTMEWAGKSILSSMLRHPVPGPLVVHKDHIEGNSFAHPQFHGVSHSVLYAFGMTSALSFMRLLGQDTYSPGALGENVTLDDFDETQISVGDIFKFGEVHAQAVLPRIPCAKVNIRMQHALGQKFLQECGRSGIYFRILRAGKVSLADGVQRIESAKERFLIFDLYKKMVSGLPMTKDDIALAKANGAFPEQIIEKWSSRINS